MANRRRRIINRQSSIKLPQDATGPTQSARKRSSGAKIQEIDKFSGKLAIARIPDLGLNCFVGQLKSGLLSAKQTTKTEIATMKQHQQPRVSAVVGFCCLSAMLLIPNTNAAIVAATGQTTVYWTTYSGISSAINLETGLGTVSSGTISYTLDSAYGTDNYLVFDWDTGTVFVRQHLLVSFPAMGEFGITVPIPITMNETGPLANIPMIDTEIQRLAFDYSTTASCSTTVPVPFGPLAGTLYENCKNLIIDVEVGDVEVVVPGATIKIGKVKIGTNNDGTIQQPPQPKQPTSGTGNGTGIPEPGTVSLLGLVSLAALRRRR